MGLTGKSSGDFLCFSMWFHSREFLMKRSLAGRAFLLLKLYVYSFQGSKYIYVYLFFFHAKFTLSSRVLAYILPSSIPPILHVLQVRLVYICLHTNVNAMQIQWPMRKCLSNEKTKKAPQNATRVYIKRINLVFFHKFYLKLIKAENLKTILLV